MDYIITVSVLLAIRVVCYVADRCAAIRKHDANGWPNPKPTQEPRESWL